MRCKLGRYYRLAPSPTQQEFHLFRDERKLIYIPEYLHFWPLSGIYTEYLLFWPPSKHSAKGNTLTQLYHLHRGPTWTERMWQNLVKPWMHVQDTWQEPTAMCLPHGTTQDRHASRPQTLFFDLSAALALNMPGQPAGEGLRASQCPSSPHPRRGRGRGARHACWCVVPPHSASQTPRGWGAAAGFPDGGPAAGCAGQSRKKWGSSSKPPRGEPRCVEVLPVGKWQNGKLWFAQLSAWHHYRDPKVLPLREAFIFDSFPQNE